MVKVEQTEENARFTLELVDAETLEPFKEHTGPDGKTYVEVEPEAEYFVRIGYEGGGKFIGRIEIDGEDLGYQNHLYMSRSKRAHLGIWHHELSTEEQDDSIDTTTSLKFSKVSVDGSPSPMPFLLKGRVVASFYRAGAEKDYRQNGFESSWTGHCTDAGNSAQEKWLKSVVGTTLLKEDNADIITGSTFHERGERLTSVEVTYCAAPGLIHVGILPKPPFWEHVRMLYPRKGESVERRVPVIIPERKRIRMTDEHNGTVIGYKEYDYFDMTVLANDSENDSDEDTVAQKEAVPELMECAVLHYVVDGKTKRVRFKAEESSL